MSNPLYQAIMGSQMPNAAPPQMNNFSKFTMAMQAMQNPAAFVKKAFPDIPPEIENNPSQIIGYLQQTRGITNQDIQNLLNR